MMDSSVQNDNKEDGIRDFEKVLEEVRLRNGGPMQHQDPSVIPLRMQGSKSPITTDVVYPSELVSTPNLSGIDHPLIPPASGHHGGNQPLNIPPPPPLASAPPIHSTEPATSVNRTMSHFQHQLPYIYEAKHQSSFSTNWNYGMYPEPLMNRNVQFRAPMTGDSAFQREMKPKPLYHMMQPWNNIRSSTSAISSTPSHVFSEISRHIETRTVRSPESTSDSSLQGDAGSEPLQDERKARNRVAAMKCRAKKLEQIRRLEKRVTDLRNLNMDLQRQVISLRGEIQSLHYVCLQHRNSGCRI